MPKSSSRKSIADSLKDLISSSYFQGLTALAGLVAAIASDNPIIRIPALLILFAFLFALRFTIWHFTKNLASWLTWKFVLGIVVGILVGSIFYPFLESTFRFGASAFFPQVEIVSTYPKDGETLQNLSDDVRVYFSQEIPSEYHSSLFVNIEIAPYIPTSITWWYDNYDHSDCCQSLSIYSGKYFSNSSTAQFEPDTTYHLKIRGLLIKNPLEIEFRTSAK